MAERWSPDHLRLHRLLLRRPALLPQGATLLLAVSGGQDSMALLGLLQDLRRLHGWTLRLWHGDHGLRPESTQQAAELADWAATQELPLGLDTWQRPQPDEAAARTWRYGCLVEQATALGASHVLTGHTASDRAETLLLQLARGSHRRGLTGPQASRPLTADLQLVRPLLGFSRDDTARLCQRLALPVWRDASNDSPVYSRNRIRAEVLPVLEELHPGATRRIAALGERLGEEEQALVELTELAAQALGCGEGLERRALMKLATANRRRLLHHWLEQRGSRGLGAEVLETLLTRLEPQRGPGRMDLATGLTVQWDRQRLWLTERRPSP